MIVAKSCDLFYNHTKKDQPNANLRRSRRERMDSISLLMVSRRSKKLERLYNSDYLCYIEQMELSRHNGTRGFEL